METRGVADIETRNQIAELRNEVGSLRRRLERIERLQVDDASGGGQVVIGGDNAILRINALTASSAQLP